MLQELNLNSTKKVWVLLRARSIRLKGKTILAMSNFFKLALLSWMIYSIMIVLGPYVSMSTATAYSSSSITSESQLYACSRYFSSIISISSLVMGKSICLILTSSIGIVFDSSTLGFFLPF